MSYKNILISKDENLGLLNINREKEKNSLNIETSKEIYQALLDLEQDTKIRCILITGNENFFSSGADIKELDTLDSVSAKKKNLFNYFDKIKNIKIPIISAVQGYAIGGGLELALLTDFIVASTDAKFSQPEINLGLIPGIGGTQRLKTISGKYNANYICLSGDIISADEALQAGFVSKIFDKQNFLDNVKNFAKKISRKPKISLIEIKRLINLDSKISESLLDERETFYKLLNSENKKIGIKNFINKKKTVWKN